MDVVYLKPIHCQSERESWREERKSLEKREARIFTRENLYRDERDVLDFHGEKEEGEGEKE